MGGIWNGCAWDEKAADPNDKASSPTFSVNPAGESRMEMTIWMSWADIVSQLASKAFLGLAAVGTTWNAVAAKYISRSPHALNPGPNGYNPFSHPDWPNQLYMGDQFTRVEGSVLQGIGANGTAEFDEAKVSLALKSPLNGWRTLGDEEVLGAVGGVTAPREYFCLRNMEIVEQGEAKAQTIPAPAGLVWATDGTAVATGGFVIIHSSDITIDWYPVPIAAYNAVAWDALVGKTNGSKVFPPNPPGAVSSFMKQRPIRTLVMGKPGLSLIRMGDGNWAYKVRIKMKYHPYGANTLWRHNPAAGNSPRYEAVIRPDGGAGQPLHPDGDFEAAFIPP